ncbi:type I methionyl aminopeptidase [Alphaproteobacteria bacterium]|nr:type I methionyl aminopeptidase [Alphaproteobacteria bacterium]
MIKTYKSSEIDACREASKISSMVLDEVIDLIEVGNTTEDIDEFCFKRIKELGATPAPLFYRGFPKVSCTSLNHVICHGIPSKDKLLKKGDILNIDVTSIIDGWHGDTSRMFQIDEISVKAQNLMKVTHQCLMEAIGVVKPGEKISQIGKTIDRIADFNNFSVVQDFCGHGVGRKFHENPSIVHYYDPYYDSLEFISGMIFTIEPMINIGKYNSKVLSDGWTAVTRDKTLSAQYEHTIYINDDKVEILTESPKGVFYS